MEEDWTGKAVSIECNKQLGIFQGIISQCSPSKITIIRAFRNGVPLRKQNAEVTLRSSDLVKISLLPSYNVHNTVIPTVIKKPTPVKQPNFVSTGNINTTHNGSQQLQHAALSLGSKMLNIKLSNSDADNMENISSTSRASSAQKVLNNSPPQNSVAQFFGNLIPSKVEVKLGSGASSSFSGLSSFNTNGWNSENFNGCRGGISNPIDIVNNNSELQRSHNNTTGSITKSNPGSNGYPKTPRSSNNSGANSYNGNTINTIASRNKLRNKQLRRESSIKYCQTFDTSVNDPLLHEDFDFEGNLALFDKQAIWDSLNSGKKPDVVQHAVSAQHQQKFRHDENIIVSEPAQMRQIESLFEGSEDFVTDEGLIIPTIPLFVRTKIETCAEKSGFTVQRQLDLLARGTVDLAILLLGGARRLTPNNRHQWPTIVIISEKSDNFRASNVGAATGRQLASHGLKVLLYLEGDAKNIEQKSIEISLFKATGNTVVFTSDALPVPDLVILSTSSANLSGNIKKWLNDNRASVLAVDPPPNGINDVCIKHAILPILPLNGISSNHYGKLYLCNLGIPDKFYRDAGVKYKSPFGHKFVIPIHSKN
uniref:Enhancer of mRNA-decapping protein 3 n=1 Tax=Glossina morsitans morsitans TaxID=37546 RepID=A0A1B0G261_GLOMM